MLGPMNAPSIPPSPELPPPPSPPAEAPPPSDGPQAAPVPEPAPAPAPAAATPARQPRNPLHGVTLEAMVVALQQHFGWRGLAEQIPVRCFQSDPSVSSSLKFLRKTPWAREKVESLYLFMLRERRRQGHSSS